MRKKRWIISTSALFAIVISALILPVFATSYTFYAPYPSGNGSTWGTGIISKSAYMNPNTGTGNIYSSASGNGHAYADVFCGGLAPSSSEGMQAVSLSSGQYVSFGGKIYLNGYIKSHHSQGDAYGKVSAYIAIYKGTYHIATKTYTWSQVYYVEIVQGYVSGSDQQQNFNGYIYPSTVWQVTSSGMYTMKLGIKGEGYAYSMLLNDYGQASFGTVTVSYTQIIK